MYYMPLHAGQDANEELEENKAALSQLHRRGLPKKAVKEEPLLDSRGIDPTGKSICKILTRTRI